MQYSFEYLAIDRVVGVAFPYRYRNIMKPRVVYALILHLCGKSLLYHYSLLE